MQVPIEYPATLSIPKSYMSENLSSTLADESVDYELHAAVLHHGKKATGGHYSVYVQDFDNSGWRSMNDTRVNSITEDHALSAHEMVSIHSNNES